MRLIVFLLVESSSLEVNPSGPLEAGTDISMAEGAGSMSGVVAVSTGVISSFAPGTAGWVPPMPPNDGGAVVAEVGRTGIIAAVLAEVTRLIASVWAAINRLWVRAM